MNKTYHTKDDAERNKFKKAIIKSFQNAINYCIDKNLDALMIAGDLFDNQNISIKDINFLISEFKKLEDQGIMVFYASGNHDYTSYDSKVRNIKYPKNVITFFDDEFKIYDFKEGYKIVGCGHKKIVEERNLIERFPKGKYIGLAHTMIHSSLVTDEKSYLPSDLKTLLSKNYLYFALGHIHKRGSLDSYDSIWYSGSLQAVNSKETGWKGGNLVTIEENYTKVDFIPLSYMVYEDFEYMVSQNTLEDMYEEIIKSIKENFYDYNMKHLSINLILKGNTDLYNQLKDNLEDLKDVLLEELGLFSIKIKNLTKRSFDYSHIKGVILSDVLEDIKTLNELPNLDFLSYNLDVKDVKEDLDKLLLDYFLEGVDEN